MPPAVSEDDASSATDIPPRKNTKQKGKVVEEESPKEDEEEDLDTDEYVVEKIKSHRFEPDGTIKYEVKWLGFSDKDNTWEPEENLEGCVDDLIQYFDKIGGKPKIPELKSKGTPAAAKSSGKKRKLSEGPPAQAATPDTATKGGRGRPKKSKLDGVVSNIETPNHKTPKWEPPKGSWEDEVVSIDTMEKDPIDGTISAYIVWADGHRSLHPSRVVHQKCPQKMLQFYEAHLQFNTAPIPKAEAELSNGMKEEEESTMDVEAVKGVASTLADGIKGVASSLKEGLKSMT